MKKPVIWSHRVHQRFQKSDHIMLRDLFDLGNPRIMTSTEALEIEVREAEEYEDIPMGHC